MTCFSKVFHVRCISMHEFEWDITYVYWWSVDCICVYEMSCIWSACIPIFPKGSEWHVCLWCQVMMLIDLMRCNVWEYTYTCIPQTFERTVCVYNRNVMLNVFLWFSAGCTRIIAFPKGSEELYSCNAIMLYPLFSYNALFGSMRILKFLKGLDDLYAHKAET